MSRDENTSTKPALIARTRRALGGGRVRATLSLGIVLGLGSVGTLAAWSDSASATSGMFSTATIDLQLDNNPGNPNAYVITSLNKTNMMPGDTVQATLPIQNKGSAAFKYTMSASATGESGLAPLMKVTALESNCSTVVNGPLGLSTVAATPIITTGRSLAATSGTETICLRVTLDPGVTTAMQNKTLNVSFIFSATTA